MKKLLTLILLITYSLSAMEFKEPCQQIRLLCGDKKEVVTSLDLMKKESGSVCIMLEDIDPAKCAIPVPNVDSKILGTIINCLEHPETIELTISLLKPHELSDFIDAIGYLKMNPLIQKLHTQKPDFISLSCKDKVTTRKHNLLTDLGFRDSSQAQEKNVTLPQPVCKISGTIDDLLETQGTLARVIPVSISINTVTTISNCLKHLEGAEHIIAALKDQKLLDFTQAILYLDMPELFAKLPAIQWALRLPPQAINLCGASGFAASKDQKIIATHDGRYVYIRDIQSGKIFKTLTHPHAVWKILFSYDNQWIITKSFDNIVRIWDIQSGNILKTLAHHDYIIDIKLSHDKQQLISSSNDDIVRIWDTQSGNILQTLSHPNRVVDIIISHDKQWIITNCDDNIVRTWNAQSGEILQTLPHPDYVGNIVLSYDKQWGITSCADDIVRIWDTHSGNILQTLSHPNYVNDIILSHDKQWIITSCNNIVRIWDTQSGNILQTLSHPYLVNDIILSHDKQWVITVCDNIVCIWDAHSGNILQTLSHSHEIWKTLLSNDKQQIITRSRDAIVRIWPLIGIETLRSLHFNHLLLITKIYEQAMKGAKLDLTSAASDELRTLFESFPIPIKNTLECFVTLPRTSIWGYFQAAARFFGSASKQQS